MNYRPLRVSKLIKEELGRIISKELEFQNALVTITEVEIDRKLESAKIKMSILPSDKTEKVTEELKKNRGRLQYILAKKINILPMPKISFEADYGPEKAARVEKILDAEENNKHYRTAK